MFWEKHLPAELADKVAPFVQVIRQNPEITAEQAAVAALLLPEYMKDAHRDTRHPPYMGLANALHNMGFSETAAKRVEREMDAKYQASMRPKANIAIGAK